MCVFNLAPVSACEHIWETWHREVNMLAMHAKDTRTLVGHSCFLEADYMFGLLCFSCFGAGAVFFTEWGWHTMLMCVLISRLCSTCEHFWETWHGEDNM